MYDVSYEFLACAALSIDNYCYVVFYNLSHEFVNFHHLWTSADDSFEIVFCFEFASQFLYFLFELLFFKSAFYDDAHFVDIERF